MTVSKHISSVALFPLCDARGVLKDALRETSDSPATRGDALVFAWRLELPEGMNVGHAANAVLTSALSTPRSTWTRRQLLIIRELMVLARRDDVLPGEIAEKPTRQKRIEPVRNRRGAPTVSRHAAAPPPRKPIARKSSKHEKDWWKLVGRDDPNELLRQRATRSKRVSREPQVQD